MGHNEEISVLNFPVNYSLTDIKGGFIEAFEKILRGAVISLNFWCACFCGLPESLVWNSKYESVPCYDRTDKKDKIKDIQTFKQHFHQSF